MFYTTGTLYVSSNSPKEKEKICSLLINVFKKYKVEYELTDDDNDIDTVYLTIYTCNRLNLTGLCEFSKGYKDCYFFYSWNYIDRPSSTYSLRIHNGIIQNKNKKEYLNEKEFTNKPF